MVIHASPESPKTQDGGARATTWGNAWGAEQMGRHHRCEITDRCEVIDEANAVCEHCARPQLFCDCSDELKRELEGWDLRDQNP